MTPVTPIPKPTSKKAKKNSATSRFNSADLFRLAQVSATVAQNFNAIKFHTEPDRMVPDLVAFTKAVKDKTIDFSAVAAACEATAKSEKTLSPEMRDEVLNQLHDLMTHIRNGTVDFTPLAEAYAAETAAAMALPESNNNNGIGAPNAQNLKDNFELAQVLPAVQLSASDAANFQPRVTAAEIVTKFTAFTKAIKDGTMDSNELADACVRVANSNPHFSLPMRAQMIVELNNRINMIKDGTFDFTPFVVFYAIIVENTLAAQNMNLTAQQKGPSDNAMQPGAQNLEAPFDYAKVMGMLANGSFDYDALVKTDGGPKSSYPQATAQPGAQNLKPYEPGHEALVRMLTGGCLDYDTFIKVYGNSDVKRSPYSSVSKKPRAAKPKRPRVSTKAQVKATKPNAQNVKASFYNSKALMLANGSLDYHALVKAANTTDATRYPFSAAESEKIEGMLKNGTFDYVAYAKAQADYNAENAFWTHFNITAACHQNFNGNDGFPGSNA